MTDVIRDQHEWVRPAPSAVLVADGLALAAGVITACAEVELVPHGTWWVAAVLAVLLLAMAILLAGERHEHEGAGQRRTSAVILFSLFAFSLSVALAVLAVTHRSALLLFLAVSLFAAGVLGTARLPYRSAVALHGFHCAAVLGGIGTLAARWLAMSDETMVLPLRAAAWLLDRLPVAVTLAPPFLVVDGVRVHTSFVTRWYMLAIPVTFVLLLKPRLSTVLRLLVVSASVAIGVGALNVWLATTSVRATLAADLWLAGTAIGSALLVFVLWSPRSVRLIDRSTFLRMYAVVVAALLLVAFLSRAPGPPQGRPAILIDEGHGRWEPVHGTVDTLSFGRASSYNYALFRAWLAERYDVAVLDGPIPESLACAVLIVKVPTTRYSANEIERVESWVRGGGTLLVIGDHTNLFGSTWSANELLAPFGLRMRDDATIPLRGTDYTYRGAWWTTYPPLASLSSVMTQTGCTVAAERFGAEPLFLARGLVAEHAEYSNDRFFGDLDVTPDDRAAPVALGACVPHGKGAVLVFGDSTVWSSFCFFTPPYKELLDGLIQTGLRHTVGPPPAWLWVLSVASVLGLWLWERDALAGLTCGLIVVAWAPLASMSGTSAPRPPSSGRVLLVDSDGSRFNLSTDIRTASRTDLENYAAFFSLLPRINIRPEFRAIRYDELTGSETILLLCPDEELSPRRAAALEAFLRRGGSVLVFIDGTGPRAPSGGMLLERFGLRVELETLREHWGRDEGPLLPRHVLGLPFSTIYAARRQLSSDVWEGVALKPTLLFAEPLLLDSEGLCVYGRRQVGAGALYVFVRPTVFSRYAMGDVWMGTEMDSTRASLYSLAFHVMGMPYDDH